MDPLSPPRSVFQTGKAAATNQPMSQLHFMRSSIDVDSGTTPQPTSNVDRPSMSGAAGPGANPHIGVSLLCKAPRTGGEPWTDAHEAILQDWKITAFIDMWLQDKSADYYRNTENLVTYPAIFLSSASSVTLFTSSNRIWTKYIVSVANVLVGILTAVGRQLKCNELHQEHSNMAGRYQTLIRAIDTCLDLPRHMRPSPDVLIEKLGSEIDALNATHLTPPYYVVKAFEKAYGPIHQLMFGDDIIQLLRKDVKNRKMVNRIAFFSGGGSNSLAKAK